MVNLETRSDKINFQHTLIKSQREARKLSCATSYQIKFQIHIKTASTEILITQWMKYPDSWKNYLISFILLKARV